MGETVTKSYIIHKIRDDTGYHLTEIEAVLNSLLDNVETELANGNRVQLSGFGTFELKNRSPRIGRDFDGGKIEIPARRIPWFSAGERLKRIATKTV